MTIKVSDSRIDLDSIVEEPARMNDVKIANSSIFVVLEFEDGNPSEMVGLLQEIRVDINALVIKAEFLLEIAMILASRCSKSLKTCKVFTSSDKKFDVFDEKKVVTEVLVEVQGTKPVVSIVIKASLTI